MRELFWVQKEEIYLTLAIMKLAKLKTFTGAGQTSFFAKLKPGSL
jgi:hypothetical protein